MRVDSRRVPGTAAPFVSGVVPAILAPGSAHYALAAVNSMSKSFGYEIYPANRAKGYTRRTGLPIVAALTSADW
jgi:hypothetical protein